MNFWRFLKLCTNETKNIFTTQKNFFSNGRHFVKKNFFLLLQGSCYSGEVMCDTYRRITRYCLTITIYLLVFVVYTSASKARYNYRFKITSSSSARYFTRWFESRRLHRCREIQIRYYVRLRTNNSDRRLPTRLAAHDRMNLCRDDAP